MFDYIVTDVTSNKKLHPIVIELFTVTELFIGARN